MSPNLRAVAMCEVVKTDGRGPGGGTSSSTLSATTGEGAAGAGAAGAGEGGSATRDEADRTETMSQVSVYHVASRRRMRTMSIAMKGGLRVSVCGMSNLPPSRRPVLPLQ